MGKSDAGRPMETKSTSYPARVLGQHRPMFITCLIPFKGRSGSHASPDMEAA